MKRFILKRFIFRVFSGTKLFLFIFLFGSSVFASSGEEYFYDTKITEKKDISVFVTRLSERLKGVFFEIISLSNDEEVTISKDIESEEDISKTLIDSQDHLYAPEILKLADLWVIDSSREKFYPDNYLRRYEFVMILVKYRLVKEKKQLSPVVFPLRGWFFDVAQNTSYAPYVAYAEQQWRIDQMIDEKNGKKKFCPNKFLNKKEVCSLLKLDVYDEFCTDDLVKRWEFVSVLYRWFNNFENNEESSNAVLSNSLSKQLSTNILKSSLKNNNQKNNNKINNQIKSMFSMASPK